MKKIIKSVYTYYLSIKGFALGELIVGLEISAVFFVYSLLLSFFPFICGEPELSIKLSAECSQSGLIILIFSVIFCIFVDLIIKNDIKK
ncbi:MAG: hypothetical protein ACI4QV_04965 [Acutalibacteraceae bacterium]